MKSFFTIVIALIISLPLWAQPIMTFDEKTHNFGKIDEDGGRVRYKFEFTNTGNAPLKISNVRASCGCTTPSWSRDAVPPGGKGHVTAEYNPFRRPGRFQKSLTINSNANPAREIIYIKGEVAKNLPKPKVYENHFSYDGKKITENDEGFESFIAEVAEIAKNKPNGKVKITVESSASKVPTKKYKNNAQLATDRAQEAIEKIKAGLTSKGVSLEKVIFETPITKVQGPNYNKDYDEKKDTYEKFQYVKITAL